MPFEPMSLPYWTVPSWNPNVNEARAAGEYPTAGWANQLQALHDDTIAKVNEAGALADSIARSVGVVGELHDPGTILIAGEDGAFKALPPGTLNQVLQPNSNVADGIEWRDSLPTPTVRGSVPVWNGTTWALAVPHYLTTHGSQLVYDASSASQGVSFSGTDSAVVTKATNTGWAATTGIWTVSRNNNTVSINGIAAYGVTSPLEGYFPAGTAPIATLTYDAGLGKDVAALGYVPPVFRPPTLRTIAPTNTNPWYYSGGSEDPGFYVRTNGEFGISLTSGRTGWKVHSGSLGSPGNQPLVPANKLSYTL